MDRFRQRQIDIIVATDVAARGIDVADITHVINYEIPDDPEVYTHRSGRTGRAGKSGICMSIVSPREVGGIRGIERVVKARFVKADIPDGAEIVRKKLFHFLEEIETASPQEGFAEVYTKAMRDRFAELDKEEIIRRLVWLQVKETAAQYQNAEDLNAGYGGGRDAIGRSGPVTGPGGGKFKRLFINIGTKDGLTPRALVDFVAGNTDLEAGLISAVTVRELSSYFNVPNSAADFILQNLPQRKFQGRKVRVDEATPFDGGGGGRPQRGGGFEGNFKSRRFEGGPPQKKYGKPRY
jgi:ATP-dependent RNA helicase DeaD